MITPKHVRVFNRALELVRSDSQVIARLGSQLKGFGTDSRSRAARQRIPNRIYNDSDGIEHTYVEFQVSGPNGQARVTADVRADTDDFTFVLVDLPLGGRSRRAERITLRP